MDRPSLRRRLRGPNRRPPAAQKRPPRRARRAPAAGLCGDRRSARTGRRPLSRPPRGPPVGDLSLGLPRPGLVAAPDPRVGKGRTRPRPRRLPLQTRADPLRLQARRRAARPRWRGLLRRQRPVERARGRPPAGGARAPDDEAGSSSSRSPFQPRADGGISFSTRSRARARRSLPASDSAGEPA